jgi:mxaA protein
VKALMLVVLVLAISSVEAVAAVTRDAVVEQPRAFGYVLGDLVRQRVLLEEGRHAFVPDELPASGPAGNWLERRAVRIERDSGGRSWLAVDYQIMNSPQTLNTVVLPAWRLTSKASNVELRVPEWSITVAPLTPQQPVARAGLGNLRPDRRASLIDVAPMERWLATWIGALVVCLAAWIGWWSWRNWRASSAQPFARALRELRGVDESSAQAWHAVHRAFDGTAGRVVQADALSALFERAPQFEPERPAIERFYAQSAERFFGLAATDAASTVASGSPAAASRGSHAAADADIAAPTRSALSLRTLCLALRQIEKRHEP